ncbi:MAG TPA: hypothetical protein VHY91_05160 [Pirellulales bacterium]|jgi:hypothetical protein|nr:hypothetical protein [Pirellulales bacterium]
MNYRNKPFWLIATFAIVTTAGSGLYGQQRDVRTGAVRSNSVSPTKPDLVENQILIPVPLSAHEQEQALAAIDRHTSDEISQLKERLKELLPDELSILALTNGWRVEDQNALVAALRNGDPTAIYEAWTQGKPTDIAGAEAVARQAEVKRDFARLQHDIQKTPAATEDLSNLESSLGKLAASKPAAADVVKTLDPLKIWLQVRRYVETAVTDSGAIASLPSGKVAIIHDNNLPFGSCVVLGNGAVMVGGNGHGPIAITYGNAAEALGFSVVTAQPVPDTQGEEVQSGVFLVNPTGSGANVIYFVNGARYVMKPGMSQKLPAGVNWVVDFDRGGDYGHAAYTVADGTYYFTPSDHGWNLYRERFDVVLDNSENPSTFNYTLDGQEKTVPANRTATISGNYPMVIRFDRGNGLARASKTLNFSGTVQVGVNARDNLWDIFPTDAGYREVSKFKAFE